MAELRAHDARRRTKLGTVVSNTMNKTVVVAVENVRQHSLYGRNVRRTQRFKVHDETNVCQVGDVVVIAESRPLSKDKNWVVREVVKETIGPGLEVLSEETAVMAGSVSGASTEPADAAAAMESPTGAAEEDS